MQIVSGRFRHRKLLTNPGMTTRPITTRVKVALFDRLAPWLVDARVADLFAGTGTLGFEALSRGAKSVVFVEQDYRAYELLRKNVATLKVADETVAWRSDVAKCSFRPQRVEDFFPYDLVFFDPPYPVTKRLRPTVLLYRALERLARPEISAPEVRLLLRCEHESEFSLPPCWVAERILLYSKMEVHLFRKADMPSTAGLEVNPNAPITDGPPRDDTGPDVPATPSAPLASPEIERLGDEGDDSEFEE